MSPALSEFSYGFALVDELIHWHGTPLTAAPYFPSLNAEGVVGYDVHLAKQGMPLFLQFKLSDHMERDRCKEVRGGYITTPFYRMKIYRRDKSEQHRLLLQLEATGHDVFYAAPEFHMQAQLNEAYLHHAVRVRSRFFAPSLIGPLGDDRQHHVAFAVGRPGFVFCSRPTPMLGSIMGEEFDQLMLTKWREQKERFFSAEAMEKLAGSMLKALRIENLIFGKYFDEVRSRAGTLGLISYLAHMFYGCTLLMVREKPSQPN